MSDLPLTRRALSPERQAEIRAAVRVADCIDSDDAPSRLAQPSDAAALCQFLSDPAIHGPIYNLPRPLTDATVEGFIREKLAERERGEGLLFIRVDPDGDVFGYSEFDIWPQWGAGDLGGALRADRQGKRAGVTGAMNSFTWMFKTLKLDLVVATGALDNVRTARMLDGLGFERKGETLSTRPDGSERSSIVWEVTREAWFEQHSSEN